MHVLSSFKDDRLEAAHQETQTSKHTCRTGTDDDHRLGRSHILILLKCIFLQNFVRLGHLDAVTVKDIVAGID